MSDVRDALEYNPLDGSLRWKISPTPRIKVGDLAGGFHGEGYQRVCVGQRTYLSHHVAWYLYHGYWPVEIDHRNHNRSDNTIWNLREVTRLQNQHNRSPRKGATSNYKGVSWDRHRSKWAVYIKYGGRVKNLGRFDSEEKAAMAYNEAAKAHFGEYAFLNEIHPAISDEAVIV